VKRLGIALLALAACTSRQANQPLPGAASPRAAVETFLGAVRAQDLQAMSVIWGTAKGPARDAMDRKELEKRELIMQCLFSHEKFRILNEATSTKNEQVFRVELSKPPITRQTNFYAVQGPSKRWFVERADTEPVKDLCREGASS
jgi:hypothetical protein